MVDLAPLETCDECGFDAAQWNRQDTVNTIRYLPVLARHAVAGLSPELASQRPTPAVWSIAEYTEHLREMVFGNRFMIDLALENPGVDLGAAPDNPDEREEVSLEEAVSGLTDELTQLWDRVRQLADEQWAVHAVLDGEAKDVDWVARHVVHDQLHHMGDIARIRHRLGDAVSMDGSLDQISASGGGVPKLAVPEGRVALRGLEGDTQKARQFHGRPWQALCLFSTEVVEALQGEGHPISAGSVGENLTLGGIDWATMRSGLHVQIGEVLCQLSLPAEPCSKNNQFFAGISSERIDHEKYPGFARWYAEVITPGAIKPGDPVRVYSPK